MIILKPGFKLGQYQDTIQVRNLIGRGTFGDIYIAYNPNTDTEVALKIEKMNNSSQLTNEYKIYKSLEGGTGILTIFNYGEHLRYDPPFRWMTMELCGPSLESLFVDVCHKKFTIKTVLMIGIQILSTIEFLHNRNIIHRDIKPDNFVLGLYDKCNLIYLIDMGLAKEYRDWKTGCHIPYKTGKELLGTARYVSINTHKGIDQSRRDDLESVAYVLLYFLTGRLPWQNVYAQTQEEKYFLIGKMKEDISSKNLFPNYPEELSMYLDYCKALDFSEVPDYLYLKQMFEVCFSSLKYEFDYMYDWR